MGARTRGLANNVLTSGKLDATDAISGVIAAGNIANGSLTSATTYGSITGGVPAVSSDPPSPSEGDIWYNTTTGKLRFVGKVGAWATGGTMNAGKTQVMGSIAGTQTATLAFGGKNPPGSVQAINESYNGSSWTEIADMNTARSGGGGAGTSTSTLGFGGYDGSSNTGKAETWTGSSWTEVADMNTARREVAGAGAVHTAAVVFGGKEPAGSAKNELWNGSSWSEVGDLNTAKRALGGQGTSTAAIAFGGQPSISETEIWNGSTWTEVNDMNVQRFALAGSGTTTSLLAFGGSPTPAPSSHSNLTELWNGTSWATGQGNMNTARYYLGGSGTTTAGLAFGGQPSETAAEEWTVANTNLDVG